MPLHSVIPSPVRWPFTASTSHWQTFFTHYSPILVTFVPGSACLLHLPTNRPSSTPSVLTRLKTSPRMGLSGARDFLQPYSHLSPTPKETTTTMSLPLRLRLRRTLPGAYRSAIVTGLSPTSIPSSNVVMHDHSSPVPRLQCYVAAPRGLLTLSAQRIQFARHILSRLRHCRGLCRGRDPRLKSANTYRSRPLTWTWTIQRESLSIIAPLDLLHPLKY
jgi:hypothetical protein